MCLYALIQNGTVVNIILANSNDPQDPSYTWIDITSVSPQPAIGWTYDGTSFSPPVPTVPPLSVAIAQNITKFELALDAFIETRYTLTVRVNLIGIGINAQLNSLTNRLAYLAPLFVWQNSVIIYCATYLATVSAMTDASLVVANTWDFTSLVASDPLVTASHALAIPN